MAVAPIGIVLLEGADSSGKTTLARELVKRYDARYLHSTVRKDIWRWHVGAVRWAVRESTSRLVVMDRLWLSELVYGSVFRGAPAYDVGARVIDRVLRRFATVTVLCAPSDLELQEHRWMTDRADGKYEHFTSVREVIKLYADLRRGNLASSSSGYLGQLTRFGDFTKRDDVLVYDIDVHRPRASARAIVDTLGWLRRTALQRGLDPRYHNVSGRGRGVLFVGEAPGASNSGATLPSWPWCGNEKRLDAASWFNGALHHLAFNESKATYCNVHLQNGIEDPALEPLIFELEPKRVVALGKVAGDRLNHLRVKNVEIVHPQWHRRFKYSDGPEGYAEKVRWAIR